MNRRQYIAALGTAVVGSVSGCQEGRGPEKDRTETRAPTDTPTVVETRTAAPGPGAKVNQSRLTTRDTSYRTEAAVTGAVTNTGDVRLGLLNVAGKFYDKAGNLLNSTPAGIRAIAPGETWIPWVPYPDEASKPAEGELSITSVSQLYRTPFPDGMVLENHSLQIPSDQGSYPRVVGQITNTTGAGGGFLDARAKVYTEDGRLLQTGYASVSSIGAGETWDFDIAVYLGNPSWKRRVSSHEIVIAQ